MKKNVIVLVAAVALVLLAVPTIAFANGMQQAWHQASETAPFAHHAMLAAGESDAATAVGAAIATMRGEYVDRDNDGICDKYAADQGTCRAFVDADGNGICDNCTADQNACPGYVDADNDGACDNYGTGARHGCGSGNVDGSGVGRGNGSGHHGCMRG